MTAASSAAGQPAIRLGDKRLVGTTFGAYVLTDLNQCDDDVVDTAGEVFRSIGYQTGQAIPFELWPPIAVLLSA